MDEPQYSSETSEIMSKLDSGEIKVTPATEGLMARRSAADCSASSESPENTTMQTPDEKFANAKHCASEAINSLAEAMIAIRGIVTLSIQQRTDLTEQARAHIDCAKHFLEDGVVANLFGQNDLAQTRRAGN